MSVPVNMVTLIVYSSNSTQLHGSCTTWCTGIAIFTLITTLVIFYVFAILESLSKEVNTTMYALLFTLSIVFFTFLTYLVATLVSMLGIF